MSVSVHIKDPDTRKALCKSTAAKPTWARKRDYDDATCQRCRNALWALRLRVEAAHAAAIVRPSDDPEVVEVIGWKKCCSKVIVKLRVPPEAMRSNALGRKCRAEFVEVLEVHGAETGISMHDGVTSYTAGGVVKAHGWEKRRLEECAPGIHFFLTREEAEAYTG
jgi:hypothetical protein